MGEARKAAARSTAVVVRIRFIGMVWALARRDTTAEGRFALNLFNPFHEPTEHLAAEVTTRREVRDAGIRRGAGDAGEARMWSACPKLAADWKYC